MAKVTHFIKDGKVLCGTKAKSPATSDVFKDVTCKKCIKKMQTSTHGARSVENRKHGFCLEFNNGNLLRIGNDLNSEIGIIVAMSSQGQTVTSMKMSNTRGVLDKKQESFFRNYFENKKSELGRNPVVSEVFSDFK